MTYTSSYITLEPGESFVNDFVNDGSESLLIYGYVAEKNRTRQITKKNKIELKYVGSSAVLFSQDGWLGVDVVDGEFDVTVTNNHNKAQTVRLRVVGQSE